MYPNFEESGELTTSEAPEPLIRLTATLSPADPANSSQNEEECAPQVTSSRQIIQRLAEFTCNMLGCDRLSVIGVEEDTERLYPLAVVGLDPSQEHSWWDTQEHHKAHLSDGPDPQIAARLRQQEIVLVDLRVPPWNEQPNSYGVSIMLVAPIILRTQLIGLLQFDYGGREHNYTDQELALTQTASDLIAMTLEREYFLTRQAEARRREAELRMEEFLGIVGHELRTPLTSIKASVQLARRNLKRVKQQEAALPASVPPLINTIGSLLERTERQVGMQNRLVNDLLDTSRIQSGHLELNLQAHDITMLMQQVIEDYRTLNPDCTIYVETPDQAKLLVIADEDRLRQVIANYVSNALKYSEADKPVTVRVERMPDGLQACVAVSDEGPGISEEQQQHLWERFYRVPGIEIKRGSGVGLGLGLHISRTLIECQGGQVGVQSQPGQGSTFWFTLPLAEHDHKA